MFSTHFLAHGRHPVTISSDDGDAKDDEDGWPTFNHTSSVRPCFPPSPGY